MRITLRRSVPSKDMQTTTPLLPSNVAIFRWKMPTVLNWMKNRFSNFYFSSYSWLNLQFTSSMSPQFPRVSPTKIKISLKSVQTVRKYAQCSETDFLFHEFFFVRVLVFEIWSILMQLWGEITSKLTISPKRPCPNRRV